MRYVMRKGALVPKQSSAANGGMVMSDIAPFVTQDGVEISSRSKLRSYEQRTGTKQIGNDFASLAAELRARHSGEN